MTIILGLESEKDKSIVIGADKLVSKSNKYADELIQGLKYSTYLRHDLPSILEFLDKKNVGNIEFRYGRKIEVSEDNYSLIAQTGTNNTAGKKIRDLLLKTESFLKDDNFIQEMLFPFKFPDKAVKKLTKFYKNSFKLEKIIKSFYSPEIRRISDLQVVHKKEYNMFNSKMLLYDRNFNTGLSEFLLATIFKFNASSQPVLLDVSATGDINWTKYCINGCGREAAMQYLKGVDITADLSTDELVDIIKGVINYTNKNNIFCDGIDYAILTKDGAETHFSNEEKSFKISIHSLLEKFSEQLKQDLEVLEELINKKKKIYPPKPHK